MRLREIEKQVFKAFCLYPVNIKFAPTVCSLVGLGWSVFVLPGYKKSFGTKNVPLKAVNEALSSRFPLTS